MVLLSFERSLTFLRPITVKIALKSRTVCLILMLVTLLCFLLHIDELISVDVKAYRWVNFAYGLCSIQRHLRLATDRIKILTHSHSFILPFLLNSILDLYICYHICQRRKRFLKRTSSIILNNKSRRSKISLANEITLTLLCQSLWLLITYFPRHFYYSLISFKLIDDHDRDNSTLVFLIRQNLLIYLAFSPTLYVILSPTLRKEIHFYLCRFYERHRSSESYFIYRPSREFEKMVNHNPPVRRQTYVPALIVKDEDLQLEYSPIVKNNLIRPKSKSTSCLNIPKTNDVSFNQYNKSERSATIHQ